MSRKQSCGHIRRNNIGINITSVLAMLMIAGACSLLAGCASLSDPEPVSNDGFYLDTICSISIYRMTDADGNTVAASKVKDEAEGAIDDAFTLCEDLEGKLSRTRKNSDISRLNSANGEWTEVSDETMELVKKGLYYSELSGGDFDITIGGVTKLWDFHAAEGKEKLPDKEALAEAVKHVGYKNIEINVNKLRLSDPKTEIDLGGIAKGYIGDKMAALLEERGVVSATINLGGNVICIGGKTDEDDFVIGVEAPFSDRTEIIGKISSRNKTLVTSGVYERKMEVGGKLYHHILDTKTGWPVETDLDAVTLTAAKGHSADIDAASTICLIKGASEGRRFVEEKMDGVEGVFVMSDGSVDTTDGAGFEKE